MARERSRRRPDESRWPSAPEPVPDPIGRLDDVIATLEEMLDDRGVPPVSAPRNSLGPERPERPESLESPEIAQVLERPESPTGGPVGPETLPLLEDVVAAAANGDAEGTGGATGPRQTEAEEKGAPLEREPLPLDFEFIPDDPGPPIGDLDLDSPAGGPDRERYGDAPPPSLDPEVYRHLVDRLANEIDVIVQTGTEEAMQRAAADIAARVREHVAIILPEVIEELVRMSGRTPD